MAEDPVTGEEGQSDKDRNFENLRKAKEAAEAELAELRPLKTKEMLRDAGFDPTTAEGKAIQYALQAKGAQAPDTVEGIQELAEAEFGYKPPTSLTPEEKALQEAQSRVGALRTESTSEPPADLGSSTDDLKAQIAELEAKGDFGRAGMLKLQLFSLENA